MKSMSDFSLTTLLNFPIELSALIVTLVVSVTAVVSGLLMTYSA